MISLIIPTLNAAELLPSLLTQLHNQIGPPGEIIIIDSSSTDQTVKIAWQAGCLVEVIPRSEFRHGRARNQAARLAHGDILVFLTQDALPADEHFLDALTRPIRQGSAAAASARQVPTPDASPIEAFARRFNYPEQSFTRTLSDVPRLGIKAFFFSNTSAAVATSAFWEAGGFNVNLIVDEDLDLCARLLETGKKVAYQSEAVAYHSHRYSLAQLFRRYFDIGVFFTQDQHTLSGVPVLNEGQRFVRLATQHLWVNSQRRWIPRLLGEALIKLVAFRLGRSYTVLPLALTRRLSSQPAFWDSAHQK